MGKECPSRGEMAQCHLGSDYYVLAGNSFDEDGEADVYSNVAIAIQLLDASTLWKQMMEDCNPNEPVTLTNEHFICVAIDSLQKWEYGKEGCNLIFEKPLMRYSTLTLHQWNQKYY